MKLAYSTNVPLGPAQVDDMGCEKSVHSICDMREGRESHCLFKIIACPTMVYEGIFFLAYLKVFYSVQTPSFRTQEHQKSTRTVDKAEMFKGFPRSTKTNY